MMALWLVVVVFGGGDVDVGGVGRCEFLGVGID